jgi:serine/threonine-protein kinase
MTGAVVGTPKYMAPEQMFGLKVDARADLFSVTMVFLDLLALLPKSPAIPRSSLPEIGNLPPNNRIDYSILYPTALIPVLLKGLSVTQAERYQSAREYVQGIKDVLPKLKTATVTAADEATVVVQKSIAAGQPSQATQSPRGSVSLATNPGDLDSLTNLLVDYVGPIARNIMVAYDRGNTPANELANTISREIPEPGEREEFLKRWEVISGTRLDSSGISNPETTGGTTEVRDYDDDMLKKMGEDYVGYIGPLAARLVQHHASTTTNIEQLIDMLAREIPDATDSEKFRNSWLSRLGNA